MRKKIIRHTTVRSELVCARCGNDVDRKVKQCVYCGFRFKNKEDKVHTVKFS